jgi:hypothetical protein
VQTLRDIAPYLAPAGAALSIILLVVVSLLWTSVRRLRRAQTVIMGHHEARDIVDHVESLASQVRNLREAVEILTDQLDGHKRRLDHALVNRAIVRYDAFRDTGGEQSASLALLDEHRSGVVISAIAARDFARIYVKHLQDGTPDRELSPEERQAVEAAVPRPLGPGEDGPPSARASRLPDTAAARAIPDTEAGEAGAHHADVRRAFDALADLGANTAAGDGRGAAGGPAEPDSGDDGFTWDVGAAPGDPRPPA